MPVISWDESTGDRLLYSPHRALDAVLDLGAIPQRLFRVFYPVWRVKVQGQQRIATDFEELEWFIERGLHEAGLTSVEGLARFFGLDARFVQKLVKFLRGIGHIEGDDAHLSLTQLGLTSMQARVRYQEQETSAELYFDGLCSRPLALEHYSVPLYEDSSKSTWFRPFYVFDRRWNEAAVQELMAHPDKGKYNLPDEVTYIAPLSREPVYLPVYVIERQMGEPDGLPLFLVFSRIRSMRDEVIEGVVNVDPLAVVPLREARRQNLEESVRRCLDGRGLDQDDWHLQLSGPWGPQVTVDAQVLQSAHWHAEGTEGSRGLSVRDIGGYLLVYEHVLAFDWCVWLTCDDPKMRQQAAVERLLEWLQRAIAMPTSEDLNQRLMVMRERLRIKPISTDTLLDTAAERGLARALERLDMLVTSDEQG
jgi:hypothetical protein